MPGSDRGPLVSVIIAARNEAGAIGACLERLACQTWPRERTEIVLVDGMSEDGTVTIARQIAAEWGMDVRVLENRRRVTPAGFNLGLQATRGDVVVVLGARARVDRTFLEASVRALGASGADAAGGVVRTVAGGPGLVGRAIALAQRSPYGVGDAGYRYAAMARAVDTVNYGAYRREVFARIGGFDESMQWVEDDELNYRLRALGGRLWLDPAIGVEYAARASLAALWRQRYRWGFNKPRVAERHAGQMRPRHAAPALFLLAVAGTLAAATRGGRWRWPLAALTAAYTAGSALADLRLARRYGFSAELMLTPAAFLTMHLAYGTGTLAGIGAMLARRLRSGVRPPARRAAP